MYIYWFFLFFMFLTSCSSPEKPIDYVSTISNLEGIIETNKDQFVVGEPILVSVFLKNVSTQEFLSEVSYRREDPNVPIQSVSFNAVHKEDATQPLKLTQPPQPFEGLLKIAPGEKIEFMKMVFNSEENGEYTLSCNVEWKVNRGIPIANKYVSVRHKDLRKIRSISEIPENLQKQITRSIFDLKSNDNEEKEKAIKKLMEGGGPARFLLVQYLGIEDTQLAQYCLFLLMEMKDQAKDDLLIGMSSQKEEVRWKCCFALEKLNDPSVIPELIKLLDIETSSRNRIRIVSVYMNLIEEPIAQWALVQAMKNEDRVIRKMAHKRLQQKQPELELDVNASFKERKDQIELWEKWWKETHPSLKVPESVSSSEND